MLIFYVSYKFMILLRKNPKSPYLVMGPRYQLECSTTEVWKTCGEGGHTIGVLCHRACIVQALYSTVHDKCCYVKKA